MQHTFALDPAVDNNSQASPEPNPAVEAYYEPTPVTMILVCCNNLGETMPKQWGCKSEPAAVMHMTKPAMQAWFKPKSYNAANLNQNGECILQGQHETSSCNRQTMLDAKAKTQTEQARTTTYPAKMKTMLNHSATELKKKAYLAYKAKDIATLQCVHLKLKCLPWLLNMIGQVMLQQVKAREWIQAVRLKLVKHWTKSWTRITFTISKYIPKHTCI